MGNPAVFPAFNGDPDDYLGSNYQAAGNTGDIDNWLVLPDLDVSDVTVIGLFLVRVQAGKQ